MLLEAGQADAALIGGSGDWWRYLTEAMPAIRRSTGVGRLYALSALVIGSGTRFICDTHMNLDPTAEEIAEMVPMAAEVVRRFGLPPKVALLSHSSFGSSRDNSSGEITAIPLLLFAYGARRIRLSTLGLLQYLAPTVQLMLGVWVFHETFSRSRMIRAGSIP